MLPPARRPAFWIALLLVGLTAWVGCTASPSATASIPTTPTATRAPATASPAPIFTATATARPTPVPLAVELAATLIAPYAPDPEPHQPPDGLWRIRFTTPEGQAVELQDVRAEGRSMEPQDWVENYNRGQVLFEGTAEDGTLWRIVEQNGERMLMWDRQISYLSDIFPYILYSYDQETGKFQAYVEPPGNGQAEDVHLTWDAEQKVWVDEDGQAVQLTNFAQSFAEHYHLTEMDLQRITIDNWEVVALEDAQGRQWVVKEGGLYRDGEEVVMPEVVGEATPSSLARREEDGQWYVMDERGLARWVIEDGEVKKYRRPVEWVDYSDIEKDSSLIEMLKKNIPMHAQLEISYSSFPVIEINGRKVNTYLLGIIRFRNNSLGFEKGNGVIWAPAVITDVSEIKTGRRDRLVFFLRVFLPFSDFQESFVVFNDKYSRDTIYSIHFTGGAEWLSYENENFLPTELQDRVESDGEIGIWYGGLLWDNHGESMIGNQDWTNFWKQWREQWKRGEGSPYIKRQLLVFPNLDTR